MKWIYPKLSELFLSISQTTKGGDVLWDLSRIYLTAEINRNFLNRVHLGSFLFRTQVLNRSLKKQPCNRQLSMPVSELLQKP